MRITSTLAMSDMSQYFVKKNVIELSRKDFRRKNGMKKNQKKKSTASVWG